MSNSLKLKSLSRTVPMAMLLLPGLSSLERTPSPRAPMWKEACGPAAMGTRMPVPQPILDELAADPDDCDGPTPSETTKLEAYRVRSGCSFLIAVWGRGNCFCGATGNCRFWVYRPHRGEYEKFLDADMVND